MSVNRQLKITVSLLLLGVLSQFSSPVLADVDWDNNYPTLNVDVVLRHQVVIPEILYFRVGSDVFDDVTTVKFDLATDPGIATGIASGSYSDTGPLPEVSPLGSGSPVAASSNGTLAVVVRSNAGAVEISYAVDNPSGLAHTNGTHFINYSEITTSSNSANLPTPVLNNSGTGTTTVPALSFGGFVANETADWTYTYNNTAVPLAGTYNGRVTYTASVP